MSKLGLVLVVLGLVSCTPDRHCLVLSPETRVFTYHMEGKIWQLEQEDGKYCVKWETPKP